MSELKLKTTSGGSVALTPEDTSSNITVTVLSAVNATALLGTAPTASTTNTVTNKIAVRVGGVTYYLLASTSGA